MHAILILAVALLLSPVTARTDDSDEMFFEAVTAVKNKDYGHAVKLFSSQAENNQHDAQYNLAVLLKAGKGAIAGFLKALTWAWAAHLGGSKQPKISRMNYSISFPKTLSRLQERLFPIGCLCALMTAKASRHAICPLPCRAERRSDYEQAYIWYSIAAAIGLDEVL